MRLHASPRAPEYDDIEFNRTPLSGADALVKFLKFLAIFWGDQFEDTLADHRLQRTDPHHLQPWQIHVQKSSVVTDQLHALRSGFHNRPKSFLAFPQGPLSTPALGNIARHFRGPNHPSGRISHR